MHLSKHPQRALLLGVSLLCTRSEAFTTTTVRGIHRFHPVAVPHQTVPRISRHGCKASRRSLWKNNGDVVDSPGSLEENSEKKDSFVFDEFLPNFFGNAEIIQKDNGPSAASGGRVSILLQPAEGVLRPAAEALDEATGGYALTFADLGPETPSTTLGVTFLASNVAYAIAGVILSLHGDVVLGTMTELASIASFIYHFAQLDPDTKNDTVRLALFIDYILAFSSIFVGLGYLLVDGQVPPIDGLISAGLGGGFFLLGNTLCATGTPYIIVHSLWHFFSAYCALVIGNMHQAASMSGLA